MLPEPRTRIAFRTAVVMVTRNRRERVLETLPKLRAIHDEPRIVVVDNASDDGTPQAIADVHPEVTLIPLARNLGAAGRNVGAAASSLPFVAFSDDDSWWADGALARAEALFDAHPRLALIAARILVGGADGSEDPICHALERSPLSPAGDLPGPRILGFVACAAIVRRERFLGAGGFAERFGVGGEEELLAIDMTARGDGLAYVRDLVAYHAPGTHDDRSRRPVTEVRNALRSAWLRRRPRQALRITLGVVRRAVADRHARAGLGLAMCDAPRVLLERAPVGPLLDADLGSLPS
jgi:GT2 family glycosyltransferase